MVLTGKPLLILKIISAVCLLYIAQYYLLFALSFQATIGMLLGSMIALVMIAVLAGATLLSCSIRQFFKPLKRLLPLAFFLTVLAHLSIYFMVVWIENFYSTVGLDEAFEHIQDEEYANISNVKPELIWQGVIHLFAFIIPFIVNFRKLPPIDPVFE